MKWIGLIDLNDYISNTSAEGQFIFWKAPGRYHWTFFPPPPNKKQQQQQPNNKHGVMLVVPICNNLMLTESSILFSN